MSRSAIPFALSIATGLLVGCQQLGNPIDQSATFTPGGEAALGAVLSTHYGAINAMGLYDVTVDPGTLSASVSLVESRSGQKNGDLYLLPIDGFLRPDSFRIQAVRRMPAAGSVGSRTPRLDLSWTLEHPFASSASIPRADLGFTGIACFLFDVPTATGHSYFTGDADVILNESLMIRPDGYFKPGALLDLTGYTANTFP